MRRKRRSVAAAAAQSGNLNPHTLMKIKKSLAFISSLTKIKVLRPFSDLCSSFIKDEIYLIIICSRSCQQTDDDGAEEGQEDAVEVRIVDV